MEKKMVELQKGKMMEKLTYLQFLLRRWCFQGFVSRALRIKSLVLLLTHLLPQLPRSRKFQCSTVSKKDESGPKTYLKSIKSFGKRGLKAS